jgi:hypothetical protein
MATTAVFAEIIVVGLQVEAWLALLVLGMFGRDWVTLSALEKWVALLTILVIAVAYMLGVVIDRIADDIYLRGYRVAEQRGWRHRKSPDGDKPGHETRQKRFTVIDASDGLGRFLDYQRSRLRVARATSVNTLLAVPAAAIFLSAEADASGTLIAFLSVAAVTLILASTYTAIVINGAWEDSLNSAYEIVQANRLGEPPADPSS